VEVVKKKGKGEGQNGGGGREFDWESMEARKEQKDRNMGEATGMKRGFHRKKDLK